MDKKMDLTTAMEIVNTQRLGQRRREEEFITLTKELITYYYSYIDCSNKKTYTEGTMNWILKNIMTMPEDADFFQWVIQIATVCCLCNDDKDFLKASIPDEYKKGISYPYLSISEDTEKFLIKDLPSIKAIKLSRELFTQCDADLKILAGFFFLGGLSITDIAEYTETKITDIAAGVQCLKQKLIDTVNKEQKSPDGEYVSLAEDNKIFRGFQEGFLYAYNAKHEEKKEELPEEVNAGTKLKNEMLASIKEVTEGAKVQRAQTEKEEPKPKEIIKEEIAKEEIKEKKDYYESEIRASKREEEEKVKKEEKEPSNKKLIEQIPKITVDLKKQKEQEKSEKKKTGDRKYYTLLGIGIAMAAILFISFVWKVATVVNNKEKDVEIPTEELAQEVTGNEEEIAINDNVERLIDAYNNQVGTVTIVLSGTTSEAPLEINDDDAYYFYGSNYEFDLQYYFSNESENESIIDIAEVALEYTDRTEHFSKENYEQKKNDIFDLNMAEYSFDDSRQTITRYTDWKETDMHTAFDYEKEDCITTWLSVLDSNKLAIETMGDGCDLLPVMPENLTTTINGETYELVFSSASGYYIKDDVDQSTEGRSTNYTIVCDAYLETF